MGELRGKVAIVTGASTGIGRVAALALAGRGAQVVPADVDDARGQALARDIRDEGGEAVFVPTDVTIDQEVAALVEAAVATFGGRDLAFNNAGVEGQPAATADCTLADWQRTLAVNPTGVWSCMRHELPRMVERGGGSIVNCASVAGLVGFTSLPAYVASKHGVVGLIKTAALEYATARIRVNAVCPGVIDTEMVERFTGHDAAAEAAMGALEPVGRMGTPEEVADAVVWLCSPQATFVTGQAIAVDGGFVAR